MKKLIVICLAFVSLNGFSQKLEGVAYYIESVDMSPAIEEMNKQMDSAKNDNNPRAAQMGAFKDKLTEFLKTFEKTETQLFFNTEATFYKERDKELTAEEVNGEQNMFMRWKPEADKIYHDVADKKRIIKKDFMGKKFLIKDEAKDYKWKFTGKQKMIGEYPCMEATYEDTLFKAAVWFTPQIPISSGPKDLSGLPGLIIEATITNNQKEKETDSKQKKRGFRQMRKMMQQGGMDLKITLEKIDFKEVSKSELKAPSKGKVVKSEEAYNKIVMEKVKEMQAMRGGKGRGRGPRR